MRNSIQKLSENIQNQPNLKKNQKEELLTLLSDIEAEVEGEADDEHPVKEAVLLTSAGVEEQSLPDQLEDRLLKLQTTYPKTAAALGRIASTLSRMGI